MKIREREQFRYAYHLALALAVLGHAFAAFQFYTARGRIPAPQLWDSQFVFLLTLSLGSSLAVGLARRSRVVQVALVLQVIAFVLIGLPEGNYLGVEFTLLQVLILQIVLYFDTTTAVVASLSMILAELLLQRPISAWGVLLPGAPLHDLASLSFYSLITLAVGLSLNRYAARLEMDQWQIQRLDRAVASLSTANVGFQQYAASAEEETVKRERKRISRDIHDTTGYALVNIIMLLENASDLAPAQPSHLRELLATCRDLAKTGLQETRTALRVLRQLEDERPLGLQAVIKLTQVFKEATGTRVTVDLGNLPWSLGARIDELLYRLVQEGMTNAFRHGKAHEIAIRFWIHSGDLLATVKDDGTGKPAFEKGIGLSGMEERVVQLGGNMRSRSLPDGFEVSASIPIEEPLHGHDIAGIG